ncbi:MAG: hypothetical protein Q8Q36_01965 [bacterium]|nr:hypothetical protein [bacterium]
MNERSEYSEQKLTVAEAWEMMEQRAKCQEDLKYVISYVTGDDVEAVKRVRAEASARLATLPSWEEYVKKGLKAA